MIKRPINFSSWFISAALLFLIPDYTYALKTDTLYSDEAIVIYEKSLDAAAEEVMNLFPLLKAELENVIGWKINFKPAIMLIKDNSVFVNIADSELITAFASVDQNLIVINYSRMTTDPFTLKATLHHELCHLLIHNNIQNRLLPRWLDEGIAQWVSSGLANIIIQNRDLILEDTVLSGRYIGFRSLEKDFPEEKRDISLAYAESRSFVEYIIREYESTGILTILRYLREGYEIDDAVIKALNIPFDELEIMWQKDIRRQITWLTFIANNLYGLLFVFGAFLLILGYIRFIIKKRKYEQIEGKDMLQ